MIFCQSCKSTNPIGKEFCRKCNTKLMLTVVPRISAAEGVIGHSMEEHLLERISMLEYTLARTQERFDRVIELMQRQATSNFYDHAMLDALITLLGEDEIVSKERLETAWQARLSEQVEQSHDRDRLSLRQGKILASIKAETGELFTRLITEGLEYFANDDTRRGVRLLEKAVLLEPDNVELNFFLGEYFYHQEKPVLAEHYLKRTLQCDPKYHRAILMLGIVCGDEGEIEQAKRYLEEALQMEKDSFAAHFGLGGLLASEGRLDEALPHFKRALLLKPTPEMYFVVGHAYLMRGEAETALKHLGKALALDPLFDAALYHLGVIYLKQNLVDKAREHFRAAYEINPLARYRSALRARAGAKLPALPVFGHAHIARRRLLTSGDIRLAKLLRSSLMK